MIMIDIPKSVLNRVKGGESIELLENYLLNNYPIPLIIKAFSELIVVADNSANKPQILVSESEYEAITSLFRIKGQRVVDGEIVKENRGRPRLKKD